MTKSPYKTMPVEELLDVFISESGLYASSLGKGDHRVTNRHARIAGESYRELSSRGAEAQRLLLKLLKHPDNGVRYSVATQVLKSAPEYGLPVLQLIVQEGGLLGIMAQMALDAWRQEDA